MVDCRLLLCCHPGVNVSTRAAKVSRGILPLEADIETMGIQLGSLHCNLEDSRAIAFLTNRPRAHRIPRDRGDLVRAPQADAVGARLLLLESRHHHGPP